jgi:polysaccharide pyruvyl transferase WcaK-like protein
MTIAHLHVADKNNKGDLAIVLAVQELIRTRWPGVKIIDFPITVIKGATPAEIKKINQADLVLIGGGGIFYSYWLPFDIKVIEAIKPPLVLFGIGFIREVDAPPLSRAAAKSAAFLAQRARAVGVRDFKTKEFLIENGVATGKIKVIGDPAALLREKKPKNFKFGHKIKIGFNLNYSGWLGFGKWQRDILKAYQEVADYFLKIYGRSNVEFYCLKHHPGENKIYPELKILKLKVVDFAPAEQKYVYGRLDLIIGMMLHVGVLAFGAGTPEISVAYDLRNHSFAQFIGCPELVVDLKDLKKGELLRRAKTVFSKRGQYQKKFIKIKERINKNQNYFLRHLV